MTNLSSRIQVPYVPSIPGNKAEKEPFTLLVTAGLSVMEFRSFQAAIGNSTGDEKAVVKQLEGALKGIVELGPVSLSLDGKPIKKLGDYLNVIGVQKGAVLLEELFQAIVWHNSSKGLKELFSVRPFGGSAGTDSQSTEPKQANT